MKEAPKIFQAVPDAKIVAIRECVQATLQSLPNPAFAQAVEGFLTPDKIIEYLGQEPPPREPDRHSTLESITRTVRILGGILEGLGDATKAAGGFLIRVGAALWWLVEAAVPKGLTGHFFRKLFALLFWFEIIMVVGGTLFNPEVQTLGLKLLAITTVLWLTKDAFRRFLLYGKRGMKVTLLLTVLAILASFVVWWLLHFHGASISASMGLVIHQNIVHPQYQ